MDPDSNGVYYIVVDEQSTGPFSLEEILRHPAMSPESLVWKPGIENWEPAHKFPELSPAFAVKENTGEVPPQFNRQEPYRDDTRDYPGQNPQYDDRRGYHHRPDNGYYRQPHNHYHDYSDPYRNQAPYRNPFNPGLRTNWLPWAIVATIVGFFTSCIGAIFGIIGIVQANKANNLYARGFDSEADSANSNARVMTIIGLILAGLGILILIFFGNFVSAVSNLAYY